MPAAARAAAGDGLRKDMQMLRRIAAVSIVLAAAAARADEPPAAGVSAFGEMTMQTLGGRLFWGDVVHFRGWRIQQNVLTQHHRLLDPADVHHASGTLEDCTARLDAIKRERQLEPLSGKAVILLHGMGRSSKSWPTMVSRFEADGYQVVSIDYPSTRCAITDSAAYVAKVVESLEGIEEIHVVAHSMGGLVARAYLIEHSDPRITRLVMLGVPNRGAEMADIVAKWPLFQWVCGPGGCQLVTDAKGLIASLPTPEFEFAVIAGGRGDANGYNPLIPGDDDGTVTVASTRLPGATDFLLVNGGMHSFLMFDARVIDATSRFFETGRLRADGEPHPIPRPLVEAMP